MMILNVIEKIGADGEGRTPKTFRSLEPKSKEVAKASGIEQQIRAFRGDRIAWLCLKITRLGTISGTLCAQTQLQCVAYDTAARKLFGDFARCNFPEVAA